MKPAQGSGKSQITKAGQTSGRFASDPNVKVKGSDKATEQSIKLKNT